MLPKEEIKIRIDKNNKEIQELYDPSHGALIERISLLVGENIKLQLQCEHEFKDGVCMYCYMEEKLDNN